MTKIEFIRKAINNDWDLLFNYVTSDMQIKYNKQVRPKEVRHIYLYAKDLLDDKEPIKRYLIDGLQSLYSRSKDGELLEEFIENDSNTSNN